LNWKVGGLFHGFAEKLVFVNFLVPELVEGKKKSNPIFPVRPFAFGSGGQKEIVFFDYPSTSSGTDMRTALILK
jgi:hypothetical protein